MARREPQSLQQLMPRVLARLAESGRGGALGPVWTEVAGPHIARQAMPQALEGGTLVVGVASAEWARTLSQQEAELCERLNARLGAGTVRRLAFRLEA